MMYRQHLLALAASALLAACGGGADTTSVTPQDAAGAMRAHALSAKAGAANVKIAAATVTPEEAARQLMDFGESVFKVYFPEHQTTQTFGPFKYRAYSSGVLLGVVVSADANYQLGGVYVMGGAFGNSPLYVGQLTSFITPVPPADTDPGPTGAGNGCHDLGLLDTEGTRTVIAYQTSGAASGNVTVDSVTGAMTTFEGQQARELSIKTTITTSIAGQTTPVDSLVKSYVRRTAEAEITNYGSSSSNTTAIAGFNSTVTTKSVYSPPWVDRSYALAAGQSLTASHTSTTTSTTTITGVPPSTNTSTSTTTQSTKYVGRESVTVPAGTYSACKYETTIGGVATTQWVIVGKGLPVKSITVTGNTTQTLQATSVSLNGQAL
jgi:hypothetical protein